MSLCSILAILSLSLAIAAAEDAPVVHMLVPGFKVEELPVKLNNQNNLRFAPDGTLTSLGYDGRIWLLRDTNGDGIEDAVEPFWTKPTLSVPLGMAWTTEGLLVSSKGKVSLIRDEDRDGAGDSEEILASGWPHTDVGSGGVDATAVTIDSEGNVFFGLLVADYSNAYRLRKRRELKPEEVAWLKAQGRWSEAATANGGEDEFSLYDLKSRRGTIQKWNPRTRELSTVATGLRVPVALAFNSAGELFNTDQEGETWMPNGNPLDELNQIITGRNYGFPPAHERWLPNLSSEPPVVAFGPQHQSACGLIFNEPKGALNVPPRQGRAGSMLPAAPAQALFGPKAWEGDAFVAGESRGRIWRVHMTKSAGGYVGKAQTIARLSMLTLDLAISPRGELYVACHSGIPDWGTGPQGEGRIFKISYADRQAPIPLAAVPSNPTEVQLHFDRPLAPEVPRAVSEANVSIEFGEYVSAGDRFEVLKPPYAVVQQQDATPRGRLRVHSARLDASGRTLLLQTDPHPLAVQYAVRLPGIRAAGQDSPGATVELDYDLTRASQLSENERGLRRAERSELVSWAPTARASGGTESRALPKPDGDWENGRALFVGPLQCAKCHRVRGEGGTAGPDLSNLIHRDPKSVLRDIREPSATIHPDYVTYQAVRKDGETIEGFVRSQSEDALTLFDAEGRETVLPRSEVRTLRPTALSLMPAGLLEGRTDLEIRDLLTYLLWGPPSASPEAVRQILADSKGQKSSSVRTNENARDLQILVVASRQDHGPGQHDYPHFQTNFARLFAGASRVRTEESWEWPTGKQFDSASTLVFYFWNHQWSSARLEQLARFLNRGGGVVLIHSAVIADENPEALAELTGLSGHPRRTGYRHMPFTLRLLDREHPILRGFPEEFSLLDEPYWPLIGDPARIRLLAAATVDGASRPLMWTREQGKGRIFATVPGHYSWTLENPCFRILLLRAVAWTSGEDPARFQFLGQTQQR